MATTGQEYTIVTYNLGFGAYTDDFTFFMDEGKESRARSKESVINCINNTADTALSYDPDFVLFQEVDIGSTRSHQVEERNQINDKFAAAGAYDNVFAHINQHLSAYGTDAAQGNAQLEMLFADMKAEYDKGNYVICGGDFNHDFTVDSKGIFQSGYR